MLMNSEVTMPSSLEKNHRRAFYRKVLHTLNESQIPFLSGGGYALEWKLRSTDRFLGAKG
jgi:hypothetical protein